MKESLFEQINVTMLMSELTYAISLIRELARKGQLEGESNEAALKLPMNAAQMKRVLVANPNLKEVMESQNECAELQFKAISDLKEKNKLQKSFRDMREVMGSVKEVMGEGLVAAEERMDEETEKQKEKTPKRGNLDMQGGRLVLFSDQADKGYREQTEMVFGIGVNDNEQRVTVIFRGSRTPADWAANKNFHGGAVKNPVKRLKEFANDSSLPDEVYIHKGFHEYLHRKDGTPEGIFEKLAPILEEYPTYTLWVTGHSLGGGLASLFAIEAASRDNIPKPVKCITHAQPLVGDARLLRSVQKLEESKKLCLLRIRNAEDGVPAVPAFSPSPSFTYVHLGQELKMYDDGMSKTIKLSDSKAQVKTVMLNTKAMMKLFVVKAGQEQQKRAHNLREHFRRLHKNQEEISGLGPHLIDVCTDIVAARKK